MIPQLLVFTSGVLEHTPDHRALVSTLIHDERVGLVIREPQAGPGLLDWLQKVLPSARATIIAHVKTPFYETLLHTHPKCGLHLSATLDAKSWRTQVPGLLGQSTHQVAQAQEAFDAACDYVTLSPAFRSISKPDDRRPLITSAQLNQASTFGPVFALGGVGPEHMPALRQTKIHGAAVLGSIFAHQHAVDALI